MKIGIQLQRNLVINQRNLCLLIKEGAKTGAGIYIPLLNSVTQMIGGGHNGP